MKTALSLRSVFLVVFGLALAQQACAQAPRLSIDSTGNQSFVLSWPATASAYVLESAAKLDAVTAWRAVVEPPTLTNAELQLVISATESAQFFRLSVALAPLPAGDFVIGDYTLVSSTNISATVSEDTYTANVSNWGDTDATVTAILSNTNADITVAEGALSFGDVPVGATLESADTFTVRHDPNKPLDDTSLAWTIVATPLPPTRFALIEKALADGTINAETALIYKVFVEFNDDRLPGQFLGRNDGVPEARALMEAADLLNTFSSTNQQLLAPFLLSPNAPGSWYELRTTGQTIRTAQRMGRTAAVPFSLWQMETRTHVNVYWDQGLRPEDGVKAKQFADELERVWPKLTGLLGVPLSTTGDAAGDPLKVLMFDMETIRKKADDKNVLAFAQTVDPTGCKDQTAGFMVVSSTSDFATLVHEFSHVILYRYKLKTACRHPEYSWMHEATAMWVEHFIYPKGDVTYPAGNHGDSEHPYARAFLGFPNLELESTFGNHEYGAYLWFFYITRGVDGGAHYVRQTWDAAATHDSLGAIEQAVGSPEAFRGEWAQFALYNWNRKQMITIGTPGEGQPYRYYANWDKLNYRVKEKTPEPVKVRLDGKASASYPLIYTIPHLAANYFHYDFKTDVSIRSFTFTHPYSDGSNLSAKVQAIVKIRGEDWKPAEDWTGIAIKTLCLDKPAENVEELIIVISNSEFTDRTHSSDLIGKVVLGSALTELKVSADGCSPFVGTVDFSRTIDQTPNADNQFNGTKITESATTSVTFELAMVQGINNSVYVATNVTATWQHTGSTSSMDNQCSGARSSTASSGAADSNELLLLQLPPLLGGDGTTFYYQGQGHIDPNNAGMSIPYTCTGGAAFDFTFGYGQAFDWWKTRALSFDPASMEAATVDPDGSLVLQGDFSEQEGDLTGGLTVTKWHWNLKQVRRPQ